MAARPCPRCPRMTPSAARTCAPGSTSCRNCREEWQEAVTRWSQLNEPHRTVVDEAPAPDANEEYLIYQTLLGAWPFEPCSRRQTPSFIERIQAT